MRRHDAHTKDLIGGDLRPERTSARCKSVYFISTERVSTFRALHGLELSTEKDTRNLYLAMLVQRKRGGKNEVEIFIAGDLTSSMTSEKRYSRD